jgi:hypothetical protein
MDDARITEVLERIDTVPVAALNGHAPPQPEPADRWPVLDAAALHGLAGDVVATIDPHTEADPVAVLMSLLVEFGAQAGKGPHAVADSAPHPARLNAVLVGDTAKGRKGSALQNVSRVTTPADPAFARERRMNGFGSGESLVDAVRGIDENTDHRLLVIEPEFARLLAVAGRDGSTMSSVVRQAWDGDRLAVRSRGKTTIADEGHVSVMGHITVDELRGRLTATDTANGFANRFLYVLVRRSKLLPAGGNLDDAELVPLTRSFAKRVADAQYVGKMHRNPAAEALWTDLYTEMDKDRPAGLLGAVTARDSAQVLRLSVTYALLDGARLIDEVHVRAAWALWCYCRESAAYIFGQSIGDPLADRLLAAIVAAGDGGLDGRAQFLAFSGHASRRQLDAARELLERRGLVERVSVQTGGRPAEVLVATRDPLLANSLCSHVSTAPNHGVGNAFVSELREQRDLAGQREQTPPDQPSATRCEQSEQSEQSPSPDADYWSSPDADAYLASLDLEDES